MRTKRHLFNHGKKFSNYEIVCKIEIEIADKDQILKTNAQKHRVSHIDKRKTEN